MLLAITPSVLVRLGLSLNDITDIGTATLRLNNGDSSGDARLYTISSVLDDIDDIHSELLPVQDMAKRMRRTHANVYLREKNGTLFAVPRSGRTYGRQYPAFQVHPNLEGALLNDLIALFRTHDASTLMLWDFLRSVHPELGNLTGVEFLIGRRPARIGIDLLLIDRLAAFTDEQRSEYVCDLAFKNLQQVPT